MTTQPSSSRTPHWLQLLNRSAVDEAEASRDRERPQWLQSQNTAEPKHSVLPDISCIPVRSCKEASSNKGLRRTASREFSSDSLDLDPDLGLNYSLWTEQESHLEQHLSDRLDQGLDLWDERFERTVAALSSRRGSHAVLLTEHNRTAAATSPQQVLSEHTLKLHSSRLE